MKLFITIFSSCLLFISCSVSHEQLAQQTLNEALSAYSKKNFNKSKILLDSIIYNFSDAKESVVEAKKLLNAVYRSEQENNLNFLDSLLEIREKEIGPLMKQFYIEDETLEIPVLIHKKQATSSSFDRCYLRAHTDKNGTFYISSHYTGERHIWHNQIKIEVDDIYAITDSISSDAFIHSFEEDGQTWEIVKFKHGSDNGTANLIANSTDKRIVITFIGPRSKYRTIMAETDKIAFRDTYNLSIMLRELIQIKSQIRNVKSTLKDSQYLDNVIL